MKQKIKVWDAPTRLFHWLLVLMMGFMWYSATQGGDMLVWHLRGGLLMLALVVFRLCWGMLGQRYGKIQPICASVFRNPPLYARSDV